ncbi:SCO family protein [Flavobacteriaceae bacterium AU392]|nr:SCO family protein [Flavobacteriaceae bacterium]RKM84970.1 SCO family protein [Flavobacteriaceae bacterium AU392]
MLSFFKKYRFFGLGLLIFSAIIISIFYSLLKPKSILPIYQPNDVNVKLVDSNIQHQKKYHKIADFSLINQDGKIITQDDYKDKIYIADFFFTTCPSICIAMTDHMYQIQEKLKEDDDIKLLSHSVTPEIDTIAQLKRYAEEKGVNASKWNLVTGDKKQIYELARKSYLAVEDDIYGGEFDMIHTENFMLIDKKRQIRGFYDGTQQKEIDRLLNDIKVLKASYKN